MVFEAIASFSHFGKGVSRQRIKSIIQTNYPDLKKGASFTAALRRALKTGIERGVLEHGETTQRYKLTDLGREEKKAGKKIDLEKERAKEKEREKKEKAKAKKKKEAEKKKKAAAKKKAATKKRTASKKKGSSKSSKKSTRSTRAKKRARR